ncbi:hypothetical protein ACP275_05G069000 [Erythranthe tilingii]
MVAPATKKSIYSKFLLELHTCRPPPLQNRRAHLPQQPHLPLLRRPYRRNYERNGAMVYSRRRLSLRLSTLRQYLSFFIRSIVNKCAIGDVGFHTPKTTFSGLPQLSPHSIVQCQ